MKGLVWIIAVLLSHWRRHPMQLATLLVGLISATALWSGVQALNQEAEERKLLYLKPGDVVEAEIERIGVLRNPVISWEEAHGEPAPPLKRW